MLFIYLRVEAITRIFCTRIQRNKKNTSKQLVYIDLLKQFCTHQYSLECILANELFHDILEITCHHVAYSNGHLY